MLLCTDSGTLTGLSDDMLSTYVRSDDNNVAEEHKLLKVLLTSTSPDVDGTHPINPKDIGHVTSATLT